METKKIFGETFDYTVGDVIAGLAAMNTELAGFRQDLHSQDSIIQDFARQALPQYEAALHYSAHKEPDEILSDLRDIVGLVNALELRGLDRLKIANEVVEKFGDTPIHLRVILRNKSGGHKSLGQAIYANALNRSAK